MYRQAVHYLDAELLQLSELDKQQARKQMDTAADKQMKKKHIPKQTIQGRFHRSVVPFAWDMFFLKFYPLYSGIFLFSDLRPIITNE